MLSNKTKVCIFMTAMAFLLSLLGTPPLQEKVGYAQNNGCGGSDEWQFQLGDLVKTTQTVPIYRELNSSPLQNLEAGTIFLVIQEPYCDQNGTVWWKAYDNEAWGAVWISEGNPPLYNLELIQIENNENCASTLQTRLTVGEYINIIEPDKALFFSNNSQSYLKHLIAEKEFSPSVLAGKNPLLLFGPVCFQDDLIWKIRYSTTQNTSSAEKEPNDTEVEFNTIWINETYGENYVIEPNSSISSAIREPYTPQSISLTPIMPAPIVDALLQTSYVPSGGLLSGCTGNSGVIYFQDDQACIVLDEFVPPLTMTHIKAYDPYGDVFSEDSTFIDYYLPKEYRLPHSAGLPSGLWQLEISYESRSYGNSHFFVSYELLSKPSIQRDCDGFRPFISIVGLEPLEEFKLSLGELSDSIVENEYVVGSEFEEKNYWELQADTHGSLIAYIDFPIQFDEAHFIIDEHHISEPYQYACSALTTEEAANEKLIHYGELVTGKLFRVQ